jgi:hypothetical protein
MVCTFQNGSLSPLFFWKQERIFLYIHCEILVEFLEVKLIKVWASWDWVPLEFVILRYVFSKPPAIYQNWVFPAPTLVPGEVSAKEFLFWEVVILYVCFVSLSNILGWQFALWSHFSDKSKKSCWVLSFQ